jgi:hypothetical protein
MPLDGDRGNTDSTKALLLGRGQFLADTAIKISRSTALSVLIKIVHASRQSGGTGLPLRTYLY